MNLNNQSIIAKLYRWYYNLREDKMPTNLCPYFWALVWMWIWIIPFSLLCLPGIIWTKFERESNKERFTSSFVAYCLLGFSSLMIYSIYCLFFNMPDSKSTSFQMMLIGFVLWIAIIIFTVVIFLDNYFENKKMDDIFITKKPSVIKEFIKAKYNSYCPRISWQDSKQTKS